MLAPVIMDAATLYEKASRLVISCWTAASVFQFGYRKTSMEDVAAAAEERALRPAWRGIARNTRVLSAAGSRGRREDGRVSRWEPNVSLR